MIILDGRKKRFSVLLSLIAVLSLVLAATVFRADAAAETVTLKNGKIQYYGSGSAGTHLRWVTHINGEPVDTGEVPGGTSSYAYCVQPYLDTPDAGTYNVVVVDDGGSGRNAMMRKVVYYLPGGYGYTTTTGSRWFGANNKTGATDYAIGHMVLSYIYEGYPDSGKIWSGVRSNVRAKVMEIVADVGNLPDPPADFEIFWVQVKGKQDTFGAFYKEEFGTVSVRKSSSIPLISDGNSNYSLEGAQYTVYTDPSCTAVATTRDGRPAIITVNAEGTSDSAELRTGMYYLKETRAPKGYALDTDVHSVEIISGNATVYNAADIPKSNPVELLIQKLDMETGQAKPQGSASLEGAEYTVRYFGVAAEPGMTESQMESAVSGKAPARIEGKDAEWVFRTDAEGRIRMDEPDTYMISDRSAELYRDSSGRPTFPIGIISVQETKAPEGYELDGKTYYAAIVENGSVETLETLRVFNGSNAMREQVVRGDVRFVKSAEGRKRMGGVLFKFTSLTTGESHILMTDKNGVASTAADWNPHTQDTNAGKTARDGIWFNGYGDEEEGAAVNDSLGALPYDTYKFEELRCEANKGFELLSDVITIERPRTDVDLGTFDNEKTVEPLIETRARDGETGKSTAAADANVTIVDEVEYKGIAAGKSYTMEGVLMDKSTGKALRDDKGNEIKGSTDFYADSPDGTIEVKFTLSAKTLGGKDAVVYEYLRKDGELVVSHADINNRKQTVKLVEVPKPAAVVKPAKADTPAEEAPETGDSRLELLAYLAVMAAAAEGLILTLKRRNDRLNWK